MKRFMAFFILVFLVAIQLPKSWLHHHDHGHHSSVTNDQDQDNDQGQDVFEAQDCLVCHLGIDSFDGPNLPLQMGVSSPIIKVTQAYVRSLQADVKVPYELRGPPVG